MRKTSCRFPRYGLDQRSWTRALLFRLLIYSNNNRTKKTRLALRGEAFSILTSVIVAVLNTSYIVAKPDLKNSSLNFSGLLSLLPK